MPSTSRARGTIRSTALAAMLACVVLMTLLGHARLTDWDEGIYAGISRAMLTNGWLTPHWNGQPWLEKPPLALWLTALSFRFFGVSEFSARLVSAFSGVALVALLHGWLTVRRNALTAWLNTLILLSTFGFQHVARVGEMDVLLALACTLALVGLCEVQLSTRRGWLLFWGGFAAALMTKGAASVTLPVTLVLWLAVAWQRKRFDRAIASAAQGREALVCTLGLCLFLVLVLPWHLAMLHSFGRAFTTQYFGLHVLTRATNPIEGHVTRWYFYLRVLLLSAAPWVVLYPVALWSAFRQAQQPVKVGSPIHRVPVVMSGVAQTSVLPFALFALTVLVLFSIAQTRLPHYIAPAYPALALLTAVWVASRLAPHLAGENARAFRLKFTVGLLACYVLAAFLTAGPRKSLHAARLLNGDTTPDNREQIALLKQVFQHPSPAVAAVEGPILTLRTGNYNPIPTTVFYSGRIVQQTTLVPRNREEPRDKYTNDTIPLTLAISDLRPHILLIDRSLLAALPSSLSFRSLATGQTLALGILAAR